jgi:hypothetical protein
MSRVIVIATLVAAVTPALGAQQTLTLLDYSATPPASWTSVTPSSSMRLAQFTIAGSDGAKVADAVVYFFGKGQGGDVTANATRWKGQFSTSDGSPVFEQISRDSSGTFPIAIAEYHGTYARGVGAGDAAAAKPHQALIAAIAETPRGTLFFQLYGDEGPATAQRAALIAFVKSMK